MSDARERSAWNHTASILALLANAHRDHRQRSEPFAVDDFHPFRAARTSEPLKVDIEVLRDVFVKEKER